jgi:triphosphoribosyl-dephospho-CoA synthase
VSVAAAARSMVDRATLAQAVRWACELDVRTFKPGNVSLASPGHGMRAEDFLVSAEAAASALTEPGLSVGERIFHAIEATRNAVGCNTNLGIVLLCAPMIQAAQAPAATGSFRDRLGAILNALTPQDADWAYRAIRLAQPGD